MLDVGTLQFEIFEVGGRRALLRVASRPYGVQTEATVEDLLRLSRWLAAEVKKLNGEPEEKIDPGLVDRILAAGIRVLSKEFHPDAGGSHEEMVKLNQASELIREKVER